MFLDVSLSSLFLSTRQWGQTFYADIIKLRKVCWDAWLELITVSYLRDFGIRLFWSHSCESWHLPYHLWFPEHGATGCVGISDFTLCFFKGSGGGVVFPDDAFTLVDLGADAQSTFKLYTHKPLPHVFKAMEVFHEKQDSCRNGYVSAVHDFKDGTVITAEGIFLVSHGLHLDNDSSF